MVPRTTSSNAPISLIKSPKLTIERSTVEICSPQVSFMNLNSTIFGQRELLSNEVRAPSYEKPLSTISAMNGHWSAVAAHASMAGWSTAFASGESPNSGAARSVALYCQGPSQCFCAQRWHADPSQRNSNGNSWHKVTMRDMSQIRYPKQLSLSAQCELACAALRACRE
jgi:hypothetical protein